MHCRTSLTGTWRTTRNLPETIAVAVGLAAKTVGVHRVKRRSVPRNSFIEPFVIRFFLDLGTRKNRCFVVPKVPFQDPPLCPPPFVELPRRPNRFRHDGISPVSTKPRILQPSGDWIFRAIREMVQRLDL